MAQRLTLWAVDEQVPDWITGKSKLRMFFFLILAVAWVFRAVLILQGFTLFETKAVEVVAWHLEKTVIWCTVRTKIIKSYISENVHACFDT